MWSITTSILQHWRRVTNSNRKIGGVGLESSDKIIMRVFVKNMRGQALMPCSQRKARLLLKQGKANIIGYNPFTIQLTYATGEAKQDIHVGIDEGARHIGIAITSQYKVLTKGEVELRQDVHSRLTTRAMYRRDRRNRKTRYRKPRFLNRKRKDGWLPPSIEGKLNANFFWIDKFCSLVPNPILHIEVGKFDIAKMIDPSIKGTEYQQGQCAGYYDVRYFVFDRDNYTCQVCGKSKGKVLHTHHIRYKSLGGTDRADNLITVCTECHTGKNHKESGILYKWMKAGKKVKQYKEATFMNILRARTYKRYPNANITYGSITTPKRKELGLEKAHYNDAIAITNIDNIKENTNQVFYIKQFRKKKRSLHEATARRGIKEPNRNQKRNKKNTKVVKGWYLSDKVIFQGKIGWISGFSSSKAYVMDIGGNYIQIPNKTYKHIPLSKLKFICHNNTWRYEEE